MLPRGQLAVPAGLTMTCFRSILNPVAAAAHSTVTSSFASPRTTTSRPPAYESHPGPGRPDVVDTEATRQVLNVAALPSSPSSAMPPPSTGATANWLSVALIKTFSKNKKVKV